MIHKRMSLSIITVLLLSFVLTFNPWPAAAAYAETDSGLPTRSGQEIAALWKKLMVPTADINNPFLMPPALSPSYAPGALQEDYIQDGVNAINFYRFISGLPYDVVSTVALNLQAQYGSVLLAAEGNFSHEPAKPANMPMDFYDKGYASTTTANIYGSTGYDDHIVVHSIDAYMEDSDTRNLDRLGHRRWILNPPLKQIGLGLAKSSDDWYYSALQIFDDSRKDTIDFHYIPYPAAGAFPIEVFQAHYAWSVSINAGEYAKPSLKEVSVSLKRLRDNKEWTLTSKNNTVTEFGAYFNVQNENYGTGPVIIFRPDGIGEYRAGDRFEVTINGLKSKSGSSKSISYKVDFMSAKNYVPTPPAPSNETHFTDISKSWAKKSIEWAVANGIVSDIKGPFRPNDSVKEEEFVKMFIVALGESVPATTGSGRWSDRYYDYSSQNGYNLKGLNDTKARTANISRLSVAELITSASGLTYTGDAAIQYLLDNGYSKGKTAATVAGYVGADPLSRAEAVQFIKNLIDADYNT